MIRTGLIGYPVQHSYSPKLFEEFFQREGIQNALYQVFPLKDLNKLRDLITKYPDLIGLNVTIPHKTNVLSYLDEISEEALAVQAVNTISINKHKEKLYLKGFNTDISGFEHMLNKYLNKPPEGALVLGTGGASNAVTFVLKNHNIPFKIISRHRSKGNLTYDDISRDHIAHYPLIINCTPAGMHPRTKETPPFPFMLLNTENTIFDLIYNPAETKLMQMAKIRGAMAYNGLTMLKNQGLASWKIWKNNLI
ncbi:MAG: shikimate dehydrogenase family protein [Bacteroidales bacterium]